MTIVEELIDLGFKPAHAQVYVALLDLGYAHIADIVDRTRLHKQIVYTAAEHLAQQKYVSISEEKSGRVFRPLSPRHLIRTHQEALRQAEQLAPRLEEKMLHVHSADNVLVHRGSEAIVAYYIAAMEAMRARGYVYIVGMDSGRYFAIMQQAASAYRRFETLRTEKRVELRLLLSGMKASEEEYNVGRPFVTLFTLPADFQSPHDIMVWQDRVGLLFYGANPYVLDIREPSAVEGFRAYCRVLEQSAE